MIHTKTRHHEEFSLLPVLMGYAPFIAVAIGALWTTTKKASTNTNEKGQDHEQRNEKN